MDGWGGRLIPRETQKPLSFLDDHHFIEAIEVRDGFNFGITATRCRVITPGQLVQFTFLNSAQVGCTLKFP